MQVDSKRRLLLKGALGAGMASIAAAAGLLAPTQVLAEWHKSSFDAKSIDSALNSLFGASSHESSADIKIKAPPIAENGSVVNVVVDSSLPNVESMAILVDKNASPLAFTVNIAGTVSPFVKTRVKFGQTSNVYGIVKSGGKLYSAKRVVKVTKGGCGG